jgi:hypothetical protein
MRVSLVPHPDFPCEALTGIEVEMMRAAPAALTLRYFMRGDIERVRLPPLANSERTDGLWQHTCFEAFLRSGTSAAYREFNYAPSTQWAAYRFTGYREGMSQVIELAAPAISLRHTDGLLEMEVALNLEALTDVARAASWRMGLSAVIEETGGRKSYWALAHPPGKPDFHHADCFALELPRASSP